MSKGIVVKGVGRNKITGGSIELEGDNSVAIEIENTFDNEIKDIKISIVNSIEKFEEMRNTISNIRDSSINPKTNNEYKEDVLNMLIISTGFDNQAAIPAMSIIDLISLLSSWITIQSALTPILAPYIPYLTHLLGAT